MVIMAATESSRIAVSVMELRSPRGIGKRSYCSAAIDLLGESTL